MTRTTALVFVIVLAGLAAAIMAFVVRDSHGSSSPLPPAAATIPQATQAQLEAASLDRLPLAPESQRVDVAAPAFSNPTAITNPLFPISDLHSAVLSGTVEGKPFHTETTLLPETRLIEWADGVTVETRVSQYMAFLGGQLEEVALDYYAQADDGSVWYFGEDVFNYHDGVIADTGGTWLAGRDAPPAMIMPASPKVGDVYRPENAPGFVFEEVRVKAVDQTVRGPRGPVTGGIVAGELHQDGSREDKMFAPGYGEFFTSSAGDVEAMALAVPTDALEGEVPNELQALSAAADRAFAAIRSQSWTRAATEAGRVRFEWNAYRKNQVPPRLAVELNRALENLDRSVVARNAARAGTAAVDVAHAAIDLELRHRSPAEIDRARFELWARQLLVDASARSLDRSTADVAALEWIRDRFAHTLDAVDRTRIDAQLVRLRTLVGDEELGKLAKGAARLRTLAGVGAAT